MPGAATPSKAGIPPGSVEAVVAILSDQPGPLRRRKLLDALDQKGHRISLAGLNRILQYCRESGLTLESPEGVSLVKKGAP